MAFRPKLSPTRKCAVLRPEVLIEKPGHRAVVVDGRGEALPDLAVLQIEEVPERADRLVLAYDMDLELAIDALDQRQAAVLNVGLLCLRVGIRS